MRILFLVESLSNIMETSRNLALRVARELAKSGHEVCVFGERAASIPLDSELYANLETAGFDTDIAWMKRVTWGPESRAVKLARILGNPRGWGLMLRHLSGRGVGGNAEGRYREALAEHLSRSTYDAAIAVTMPFNTAQALAETPVGVRVIYEFDPFSMNESVAAADVRAMQQVEDATYGKVSAIFALEAIYNDILSGPFPHARGILHRIEFPCVVERIRRKTAFDISFSGAVNLCFCGSLYADIRNPGYMFALLERLPENVRLYLIGETPPEVRKQIPASLEQRVMLRGRVPEQAAINAMLDATILVNIGNTVKNQFPSKLFDYIGTGKPILNLIKYASCPTRDCLSSYPDALTIDETMPITSQTVEAVREFCERPRAGRVPFSAIEQLYRAYTPAAVAQKIEQTVQKALAGDGSRA